MKKKLFIYYSLSGNGDLIADFLKHTHDIRKVYTKEPLPKIFILKMLSGGFKATINYKDKLDNFDNNIEDYDEIIIGSPIWNDRLSSPINRVLEELKLNDKRVKCILYSGSGKCTKGYNKLKERYNCPIYVLKEPIKNVEELNKIKNI
jgi:flavodoxin